MIKVGIQEIVTGIHDSNFMWLLIPIFFIGIVTDKYQEEFGTSVGNAISNGTTVIFTGFAWIQYISSRINFPVEVTFSQYLFSIFIILYGFAIITSGFLTAEFATKYGRIRVITFMLMFFTMIIYVPILYNFVSILLFVFLFPFYYVFITELIKIMPPASFVQNYKVNYQSPIDLSSISRRKRFVFIGKVKMSEYLK